MIKAVNSTWHHLSSQESLRILDSDIGQGLTSQQADERLKEFGPNELVEQPGRSLILILWEQLRGALILLLFVAAIVSAAVGDIEDAVAILAIVALNTALGVRQEYKAEEAMTALKRMSTPVVKLRRDGRLIELPSQKLVPGDVLVLEAGAAVPADIRLLETAVVRIDEAILTGESEPVDKSATSTYAEEIALGDRRNMAYRGTKVVYGRATGIVVETGMRTELGRIADLIQTVDKEPTPLQRRLDRLGRTLVVAAIGIVAIVFVVGLSQGQALDLMFITAVSLAVAAAPEGLPAVATISLALGARRMLARDALIRSLPAVETLGSVTCICSDKTGTLTQNRMRVTRVVAADGSQDGIATERILAAVALCNDAELQSDGTTVVGEPTEAALVAASNAAGLSKLALESSLPRIAEAPFDSERKRMSTVHRVSDDAAGTLPGGASALFAEPGVLTVTKGALDMVLGICESALMGDLVAPLGATDRESIIRVHDEIAASGMRVLAVGIRHEAALPDDTSADELERGLTYLGLVAMVDPPRPEAKDAVAACEQAGIRTVMITGDHPATALYIAHELGIGTDSTVMLGVEIEETDDAALRDIVERVSVYARVSPQHKLRIVNALQSGDHVVAMTGDGVNDAPALKRADIGVAMGLTGSDVSREAADVVLLDDNFATIVAAVKEGRVIFDNIRKFIKFLLAANSGELWVMLCGPLLGMPLPLLPIQILWMNLITDGLPALALGLEPAERDVMNRPPYETKESVFSRGVSRDIIWTGLVMGAASLCVGWIYWDAGNTNWRTMLFTTLTLSQLTLALAIRSDKQSIFQLGFFTNPYLAAALVGSTALQLAAVYLEPLQNVLDTSPLSPQDLLTCLLVSTVTLWMVELEKVVLGYSSKLKSPA